MKFEELTVKIVTGILADDENSPFYTENLERFLDDCIVFCEDSEVITERVYNQSETFAFTTRYNLDSNDIFFKNHPFAVPPKDNFNHETLEQEFLANFNPKPHIRAKI